jgi:signal peptidase I
MKGNIKKAGAFLWNTGKLVGISLVLVILVRYFIVQPFFVRGSSMEPSFFDGEYLVIDEISYRLREPKRGEAIIFRYPLDPSQYFIKRVIGLPGDRVEIHAGKVEIFTENGSDEELKESYLSSGTQTLGEVSVKLAEGEYFVMGDNREASSDSRMWGILPDKYLIGKVWIRAWPIERMEKFKTPVYTY